MLPFILLLMGAAVVTAYYLFAYLCTYILPVLVAIAVGHLVWLSGGGWLGAVFVGAFAFAATVVILRLAFVHAPGTWLKWLILALVVAPAAFVAQAVASALLVPLVPSGVWRAVISLVAAVAMAFGAGRRFIAPDP